MFNDDLRALAGVTVRAGITGNKSNLYFVDAFDIYHVLDGIYRGLVRTDYKKLTVID